jgi:hypothetical protein
MAINTNQWRSIGINGKTSLNYRIVPWCYRSMRARRMVGRFALGAVRISAVFIAQLCSPPARRFGRLVATGGDLSIR